MTAARRVAVTGIGAVAACGIGADAFFAGLCGDATDGMRTVEGFDASAWFDPKEARRTDRFTQFAIAAATEALAQALLIDEGPHGWARSASAPDPQRTGVLVGTGVGGIGSLEDQIVVRLEKGPRRVSPFLVPMMMANAASATISMRFGYTGPCETITTACAAGTHSLGAAARLVRAGACDVMVAGGSEAPLTPTSIAAFTNMTALSASGHSCPFDVRRDGFVMGEGAGILILEELEHARRRGASVLAEILGSASGADAHHITAPAPGGAGALRCMQHALADAGIPPGAIGHVNAHGTSTPLNDAAEAAAIARLFADAAPPVTSVKGVLGHALGAAGALEAVACVKTLLERVIPPTVGFEKADDGCTLDIVAGAPRPYAPAPILSNSFGFGGHNGCLVIGPAPA